MRQEKRRYRRLTQEEFERRRRTMTLVLDYLADHGISMRHICRRVGDRLGTTISDARLQGARKGFCRVPPGFIQACCDELEKPVAVVMGEQWLREDGPHFGFGPAPSSTGHQSQGQQPQAQGQPQSQPQGQPQSQPQPQPQPQSQPQGQQSQPQPQGQGQQPQGQTGRAGASGAAA
jgi:hypothetical protein